MRYSILLYFILHYPNLSRSTSYHSHLPFDLTLLCSTLLYSPLSCSTSFYSHLLYYFSRRLPYSSMVTVPAFLVNLWVQSPLGACVNDSKVNTYVCRNDIVRDGRDVTITTSTVKILCKLRGENLFKESYSHCRI